jgi:hypothetical protein
VNHPWRDAHPLGWVVTAVLVLTAAAGVAGALPHKIGA